MTVHCPTQAVFKDGLQCLVKTLSQVKTGHYVKSVNIPEAALMYMVLPWVSVSYWSFWIRASQVPGHAVLRWAVLLQFLLAAPQKKESLPPPASRTGALPTKLAKGEMHAVTAGLGEGAGVSAVPTCRRGCGQSIFAFQSKVCNKIRV